MIKGELKKAIQDGSIEERKIIDTLFVEVLTTRKRGVYVPDFPRGSTTGG
jgi:hypothetical protein